MKSTIGLLSLVTCLCIAPVAIGQKVGQQTSAAKPAAAPAAPAAYTVPRNSLGQPNLEGIWTQNFLILMEASPKAPSLVIPEAAAKVMATAVANGIGDGFDQQLDPEVPVTIRSTDGLPIVRGERRTRSVVLPADGKLPYTPEARKESSRGYGTNKADNPEERPNWERCITSLGLPPVTGLYTAAGNPRHIIQTRDAIVLHTEYGDEARIIPFATKHQPAALHPLLGDAIARWDGDTLVIETVGLPANDRVRAFSNLIVPTTAKVTERFTRLSDKELLYQYTVEDPTAYTAPWLAEYSLYRTDQRMFEHACHEGNYSLPNILKGERVKEARAAAKAPG
jgi:hypothetical protein